MKAAHTGRDDVRQEQRWQIAALSTPVTRRLATVLFAALALFAFQLVHAQTSSAATGVACLQMGLRDVATDPRAYYPPGSTVHFAGSRLCAPSTSSSSSSSPDGSSWPRRRRRPPDSDSTTDPLGQLHLRLPAPAVPPVEGTYTIDVLGTAGMQCSRT